MGPSEGHGGGSAGVTACLSAARTPPALRATSTAGRLWGWLRIRRLQKDPRSAQTRPLRGPSGPKLGPEATPARPQVDLKPTTRVALALTLNRPVADAPKWTPREGKPEGAPVSACEADKRPSDQSAHAGARCICEAPESRHSQFSSAMSSQACTKTNCAVESTSRARAHPLCGRAPAHNAALAPPTMGWRPPPPGAQARNEFSVHGCAHTLACVSARAHLSPMRSRAATPMRSPTTRDAAQLKAPRAESHGLRRRAPRGSRSDRMARPPAPHARGSCAHRRRTCRSCLGCIRGPTLAEILSGGGPLKSNPIPCVTIQCSPPARKNPRLRRRLWARIVSGTEKLGHGCEGGSDRTASGLGHLVSRAEQVQIRAEAIMPLAFITCKRCKVDFVCAAGILDPSFELRNSIVEGRGGARSPQPGSPTTGPGAKPYRALTRTRIGAPGATRCGRDERRHHKPGLGRGPGRLRTLSSGSPHGKSPGGTNAGRRAVV